MRQMVKKLPMPYKDYRIFFKELNKAPENRWPPFPGRKKTPKPQRLGRFSSTATKAQQ
jgi:hypothetical protein